MVMEKLIKISIGIGIVGVLLSGLTMLGACTVGVVNCVIKECKPKKSMPSTILIKNQDNERHLKELLEEGFDVQDDHSPV
jgi:hypothetical protein